MDNAIKYTEHGKIIVNAKNDDEKSIVIKVSDTGIGILLQDIPHIFDRFYRVEEARSIRGAGLGLAIAKEIVRAHDGEIEVSSAKGKGATFTLRFSTSKNINKR